jgi:eukaryotic-like serine/threonine-protein kinase
VAVGLTGLAPWPEIDGYLDRALDLAPRERELWLSELTSSQPGIARILRQLLAEREALNASQFLEDSPLGDLPFGGRQGPARSPLEGTRIGAYTIERLLGRGGMGEVWLASRSDGRFEAQCAIKFLDGAVSQEKLCERFRREGRLLARLAHPNIARLLDAGATADGKQFLVLEYVDGDRIDRYCDAHSLDVEARIRLFIDAVLAVSHAHSNLVVHRDLKPSNVLVTRGGAVKLLDFGIAKLIGVQRPEGDESTRTLVDEIVLTPEYAAPEQLLGELPSTATDVYQLGMLLYVLLIGRHPLQTLGTRADRIRAALCGRVPRASDLVTGALRKKLRGDLDAILATALHIDPRRRYQTAAALRDELLRYLHREPVVARLGASFYGTRKFIVRHRVAVAVAFITIVALCATLAFALTQGQVASEERDRAFALATRNSAVTEFLGMLITEAAEADKPVTVSDMLSRSEKLALADTSGNPESRAAVLRTIGLHYLAWGDRGKAAEVLERALAVLGDAPAHGLHAEVMCAHALVISGMGRASEAAARIDQELSQPPANHASFAECLKARSVVAGTLDDAAGSLLYAREALQQLRLSGPISNEQEADVLQNLAWSYHRTGRHREAIDYYEMALQKFTAVGRGSSAGAMVIRNNMALVSEAAGMPKRALQLYDDTLAALAQRSPDAKPPVYLAVNRSRALEAIGRLREAQQAYESAMQIAVDSQHTIGQMQILVGLAAIAIQLGDMTTAAAYLDRTSEVLGSVKEADKTPRVALMRGRLALARGDITEARRRFEAVAANTGSKATAVDGELGKAEALLAAGDPAAAKESARVALSAATSLQSGLPYSQRTGRAWLLLGRALRQLHETAEAERAFTSAVMHLSNTVDENQAALVEARALSNQRLKP